MAKTGLSVWNRFGPRLAKILAKMERDVHTPILGGPGIKVEHLGDRVVMSLEHAAPHPTSAIIRRFRVKSEDADHLVCRTWNVVASAEGSVNVLVAKPYLLRRTPFDTVTIVYPGPQSIEYTYAQDYEREADDGVDTETQVMTPRYFVNEQILAARGIADGTGVAVGGVYMKWEDLNGAGRHWAKDI